MTALVVYARERGAGTTVALDVLRNEQPLTVTLTLGDG
jgi:S1-C subfamily serine protease